MCGIAGWLAFDQDLTKEREIVDRLTDTMSCRGPDARGTWVDRHIALGHRRLSVIDLEGGAQPMSVDTADGPVVMIYSGEAYNFVELRAELHGRGHTFGTSSDTEVVLHAYLEWGEAMVDHLNGMYAFAIWDARVEKLVMIRDRLGIKPFYFHRTSDGVLFGSEPKAIFAHPGVRRAVGPDGLCELMTACKTPGHAVWEGLHEIRPGTMVVVDREGLRQRSYWTLRTKPHTDDLDTTIAKIRELLDDTVARQLVADVPRCVLLSGGLDSSSLTALAADQLGRQGDKIRSFSVDFVGLKDNFHADSMRATPDSPFVHAVADHVGSLHQDVVLPHSALIDSAGREAVITARDFPIGVGDVDVSFYWLCKAIREHSTVAISGEGSDELFAGYPWFHDPEVQQADIFPWMVPVLNAGTEATETPMLESGASEAIDVFGYIKARYQETIDEVEPLEGESDHERRMRRISYAHLTRFLPALLDRKDRISMSVGLEVRVPYVDHRLVEYVYNVPWAMKSFDGREKSLLRAACGDVLPKSVVERVKSPYPSTQDPGYAAELQRLSRELLSAKDHPIFEIMNREWVDESVKMAPEAMPDGIRERLDRIVDIGIWLDLYRPEIRLP